MDAEMVKLIINAGSFGLVIFTVLWLFTRHIPSLNEAMERRSTAFIAALDRQHSDHAAEVEKIGQRFDGGIDRLDESIAKLGDRLEGRGTPRG